MNTGPVQVSFPDSVKDPIANAWVKSFKSLGHAMRHDPFCGKAVGGYTNATTIDPVTKTRSYAGSAYYKPAARRSNLQLITGALVEKLLFTGSTSDGDVIATDVQFAKDGESQTIKARKEVILSAGAFNSPKILELSGIGSRTLLDEHKIPVVDNPNVGENLQDHVLAGISFEVQDFINTKDDLMRRVPEVVDAAMNDYKTHQFGPFTVGGNYSSALLPVPDFSRPETGASELSAVLDAMPSSVDPTKPFQAELAGFVRSLLTNPEEATGGYFTYPAQSDFRGSGAGESIIRTKFPENYITIAISLLHPLSCGSSHIASADPKVSPVIDPRYLSNPADVELLARHVRYIDVIAKSEPLASMLKPGGKRSPGIPDDLRDVPLDKVKDFVKSAAKSTFHPTSTCAMMPREKGGVVDSRLRVWGTKGLRVVDASVIPIITRGNPQSSVYAIADKLKFQAPISRNSSLLENPHARQPTSTIESSPKSTESIWCQERFDAKYLENARDLSASYCSPESEAFTCFWSSTVASRFDGMCHGYGAIFDANISKFRLGCSLRELAQEEIDRDIPKIPSGLSRYWYETGPGVVVDQGVLLDADLSPMMEATPSTITTSILVKREGNGNVWHCLMEIMSLWWTLDVLHMSLNPRLQRPYLDANAASSTQVILMDNLEDGIFIDLWRHSAKMPIRRLRDLDASEPQTNLVIPFAGGGNPLWQGDWDELDCRDSPLLKTSIPQLDLEVVDFEHISFAQQLRIIRETDLLIGIHGAGLTHTMFLPPGSAVVEILPGNVEKRGFQNFAQMLGHGYQRAHGKMHGNVSGDGQWAFDLVELESQMLLDLVGNAVRSLNNRNTFR
ncbi:hypothetical protein MHUMG1_10473 [Metarhizium humberi]|uniref:Glucose-methanol-choline oxidoreductase N-terminal domain-containing protein n=1 Tax=Metarhizium humberi TaxID=2596975 RepID=A0A9P8M2Q0_9HYPO|nr:hypothetical protein MHUMG1_10473 [Metarhizium humberi]